MTTETWWVYLLYAGLVGPVIPAALAGLRALRRERQVRRLGDGFRDLAEVHRVLMDLINVVNARRALVIVAHNHFTTPSPHRQARVTVMYEATEKGARRVWRDWEGWPVDPQYAQLLSDLFRDGFVQLVTADMDENSALASHYKADGVTFSEVYRLGCNDKAMWYLSINFDMPLEERTSKHVADVRANVSRLRNIYDKDRSLFAL